LADNQPGDRDKIERRMRSLAEIRARHAAVEATPYPLTLGVLLDQAAERYGDRPFLDFFELGERLTFAEARTEANRLAAALHGIGVEKESRVAVMLPNLPAFPLTWLALARLGAVMVPVNNRYTARELAYVLEDAEADYLVIHADHFAVLDAVDPRPARITDERIVTVGARRAGAPHHWPDLLASGAVDFTAPEPVAADDLLNIQYTSGTTGLPKGCRQTHRYWVLAGLVTAAQVDFTVSRILCAQSFYYLDPQIYLAMAFVEGAAVYVANGMRAGRFMAWVRQYDIDFVFLFEPIFKQPPHPDDGENKLGLACLFGLTPENHAPLEARFATVAREWYGMTEIGSGLYMPMAFAHMVGSGSCGIPAPFREVSVRDAATGRPVAHGEVGELWVRGSGIMAGYYNRPAANAESFRDGWFRTGDLFRQDAEGFYYIVGRLKDMIRRSAENIAAREVEAVLRAHPDVREAAVVPVPDELRGEEVKAYVQLMPGKTRDDVPPEAIFAHCRRDLASFKIPRYLAYRDGFPYGPADRVEKHKLVAESDDLRRDSFDRVDGVWR
jgi:acyl-CoA synthetase (AMP-forming)/AMP-acid ligase II